jgi:uncharacterized membrane protein (UPF0136 family)
MEGPAYALSGLCAIGGFMGYSRKNSLPSLIAGFTFSVLYGTAGYLLATQSKSGLQLALGTSSILLVAGIIRANQVNFAKPVPNILVALGAISTGYYGYKFIN